MNLKIQESIARTFVKKRSESIALIVRYAGLPDNHINNAQAAQLLVDLYDEDDAFRAEYNNLISLAIGVKYENAIAELILKAVDSTNKMITTVVDKLGWRKKLIAQTASDDRSAASNVTTMIYQLDAEEAKANNIKIIGALGIVGVSIFFLLKK